MAQSQNDSRSRVPLELIEHILDNLKEDRASLEASSLVSRTWIPHTRRHLFGEVTLGRDKDRIGLARSTKMTSFMQLCTDTHSTIPVAGIQTIEIEGTISGQFLKTFLRWLCSPAPSSNDAKSARTMADYVLWNVDHLKYNHVFRDHAWALLAEIPKSTILRRRVRTLTISTARLNVIEECYRLMQTFESLEFLTLRDVSLGNQFRPGDSHIFPTLPNTFRCLHIHNVFIWPFVHFRNLQTLRELSIHLVTPLLDPVVLKEFLAGSAFVMNGALKLCTIHFHWSSEPSAYLALERTIVTSKIPGWVFKGSIVEVVHFLNGIFEPDSPLKDPAAANKIRGLILDTGYDRFYWEIIKSRIQSLDKMVESYALFDSLKEVRVTVGGSFLKEDLFEAGWRDGWVRPESKPRIEMEEKVKELKQLAPCCTRRGVLRTLIVYRPS